MSYQKTVAPTGFDATAALTLLAQNEHVAKLASFIADVVAAGSTVALDTGETVWCASILCDDPETPAVEVVAVALQVQNAQPRLRDSGVVVGCVRWHTLPQALVARWTLPTVRKGALMMALGEPQVQVDDHDMFQGADGAYYSVRTQIALADAMIRSPEDVL